jgi:hypothetical protein
MRPLKGSSTSHKIEILARRKLVALNPHQVAPGLPIKAGHSGPMSFKGRGLVLDQGRDHAVYGTYRIDFFIPVFGENSRLAS